MPFPRTFPKIGLKKPFTPQELTQHHHFALLIAFRPLKSPGILHKLLLYPNTPSLPKVR